MDPARRLQLSREDMRELGYRVVDILVAHHENLRDKPVTRMADWKASREKLGQPFAEVADSIAAVLEQLQHDVFGTIMHVNHPRFFAFVPGPGNFVGAMADALAAGFNVFTGTWMEGSGAATVELITVDWLRRICGLPDTAQGLFVSGGSVANLTALAVARHVKLNDDTRGAIVYYSDQTHSSLERGLRLLGLPAQQTRRLASDEHFRLPLARLEHQVNADRAAGLTPFCLIANGGTTNTGAIDPLGELADFCRREGLWLHCDGAYGAAAALSERGRSLLSGIEAVDSLSIDPHKWLFQPFEIGCVLVRHGARLKETFQILPEYLQDVHRREGINFCDYGIQLTRYFRALKLWMSLRIFGLAAFRDAIEWGFTLAEVAERELRARSRWEIVSAAQMGILCFRYSPPGWAEADVDALNQRVAEAMFADGYAALTTTVLRGRTVLRMCTINPRTAEEDIRETIERLDHFAGASVKGS